MSYSDPYLHWGIGPWLGLAIGGGPGLAIGTLISIAMEWQRQQQQPMYVPLDFRTLAEYRKLRAKELRDSASRIKRFCDFLELIADNRERFFLLLRS